MIWAEFSVISMKYISEICFSKPLSINGRPQW
jgi:hypothetical protein